MKIRSAFTENWHKYLFVAVLFLFFLLPLFIGKNFISKEQRFMLVTKNMGDFAFQAQQIYHEKKDIDLLLLGSSDTWASLNPNIIKASLKKDGEKDPNIITFASNWRGEEILYFQIVELLKRRKVKACFVSIPDGTSVFPHAATKYLFDFYEDYNVFKELNLINKIAFYCSAVLSTPKIMLSKFATPVPFKNDYNLGMNDKEQGWLDLKNPALGDASFEKREDIPPLFSEQELLYTGVPHPYFEINSFSFPKLDKVVFNLEKVFFKKTIELLREHNVKIILFKVPHFERDNPHKNNIRDPNAFLGGEFIPILSTPIYTLFKDHDHEDIKNFYYNSTHMNANGNRYITKAWMPIFKKIYHEVNHGKN